MGSFDGGFHLLEAFNVKGYLANVEFLIDEEKRKLKKDNKVVIYGTLYHWKYFTKQEQICFEYTLIYFEDEEEDFKIYIDPTEIDVDYISSLSNQFDFYFNYVSGVELEKISLGQSKLRRLMVIRQLAKKYPVKEQTN